MSAQARRSRQEKHVEVEEATSDEASLGPLLINKLEVRSLVSMFGRFKYKAAQRDGILYN